MLAREAVRLDWRLLWRSLHQSSGEPWLVAAVGGLALSTMAESSAGWGQALGAGRLTAGEAAALVGLQVWMTFGAAFGFVLVSGELSFARELLVDLAVRPITRSQAFVALQASSWVGRHLLASVLVGLPLTVLFASWLHGAALLGALTAAFVMTRLAVPVLLIATRILGAPWRVVGWWVASLGAVVGAAWATGGDLLHWLPPTLVMRVAIDGPGSMPVWIGLAAWTLCLAAVEFLSMNVEAAPHSPRSAAWAVAPLSRGANVLSRLVGAPPALVHGELVRLARWRRFQMSWAGALAVALVAARATDRTGAVRLVVFSLVPPLAAAGTLASLFACDRSGFQAFVLLPVPIKAVLRAKVSAVAVFALVAEIACWSWLAARGPLDAMPLPFVCALLAAGFFLWLAALGLWTSVAFPRPSDPRSVGGSLVSAPTGVVTTIGGTLWSGAAVGLSYQFDSGRVSAAGLSLGALALLAVSVLALSLAARLVPPLFAMRREAMVFDLVDRGGRA